MFELTDIYDFKRRVNKSYEWLIADCVKIKTTTGLYIVPKNIKLLTTEGFKKPKYGDILIREDKHSVVLKVDEFGHSWFIKYDTKRFYNFWRMDDTVDR